MLKVLRRPVESTYMRESQCCSNMTAAWTRAASRLIRAAAFIPLPAGRLIHRPTERIDIDHVKRRRALAFQSL